MTSYLIAERNSLPRDIGYGINKSSNGRGSVAADSVVAYWSKENKSEDAPARCALSKFNATQKNNMVVTQNDNGQQTYRDAGWRIFAQVQRC
jgi:hypothetical protein